MRPSGFPENVKLFSEWTRKQKCNRRDCLICDHVRRLEKLSWLGYTMRLSDWYISRGGSEIVSRYARRKRAMHFEVYMLPGYKLWRCYCMALLLCSTPKKMLDASLAQSDPGNGEDTIVEVPPTNSGLRMS